MIARFIGLLSFATALAGCGGQSSSSNGTPHGGSANGGGGNPSSAGTSAAGQSAGGTSAGGSTAGTGGAALDEACSGPPTKGDVGCLADIPAYTYDPNLGVCRPISYGGCGGTENLYSSLQDCQAACSEHLPSNDACKEAAECVLTGASCCGPCDGPDLTTHDFIAYNFQKAPQFQLCGDVACGPCPDPGAQGTYKYFFADCVKGRCVVEDLRETPFTECELDTDCSLRHGTACCQSCSGGGNDVVAVRSDGSFEEFACKSPTPCLACVPAEIEQQAVCSEGRCAIGSP